MTPYMLVDFAVEGSYDSAFCPICNTEADLRLSQQEALRSGLSVAICGEIIFQVVKCHELNCSGRFIFRDTINSVPVDMQDMILLPHSDPFQNIIEQNRISIESTKWPDRLNFKYRKPWDENYVSQEEFLKYVESSGAYQNRENPFPSEESLYQYSEKNIWDLLNEEIVENRYLLKRLYPNDRLYNALITCIAQQPITDSDPNNPCSPISETDLKEKQSAFRYLLKFYNELDIQTAIEQKLADHRVTFANAKLKSEVDKQIINKFTTTANKFGEIHHNLLKANYNAIKVIFRDDFNGILHPICTKYFLEDKRKDLLSWVKKIKPEIALFVDAPMGIGKTYSIAEGLASIAELSAVIFMPTKRLCKELRTEIVEKISFHQKKPPNPTDMIAPSDPNWQLELDENGDVVPQYKEQYYLDRGIYLFDGINKDECSHYNEILNRYNSGYYRKSDICGQCKNQSQCRFRKHRNEINKYRIIITTHYMYDFFFNSAEARKIDCGVDNKGKPIRKLRDVFIIDEDFIFGNCYQPITFTPIALTRFIVTLTNFLKDPDFIPPDKVQRQHFQKTDLVLGLAAKTMETSVIPPIAPNFKYPTFVKNEWEKTLREQEDIIPDDIFQMDMNSKYTAYVGDHIDVIENAIRKGFVVQVFKPSGSKEAIKSILLPNPKHYSFKGRKLPAHVFFDGTKIESSLIRRKLKGVQIKSFDIKIENPLWEIQVWQNIHTDLPKNKTDQNKPKIEKIISGIIKKHGEYERYFILTNKLLKKEIEQYLSEKHPGVFCVVEYFGGLRGVNTAKRCNVGIVLGSLILPDAVETAMAFDLIYRAFRSLPPYPMKTFENIWNWRGSLGTKKYKEKFSKIEDFSRNYRHSEYRQALARTRYLLHPVTFYIFSKEKIDSYEPFVNQVEDFHYRSDIFTPRPKHSRNKYEEIEKIVLDWLKTHESVSATDIYKNFPGYRRQTVGTHLNAMKKKGVLINYEKIEMKSTERGDIKTKYKKRYTTTNCISNKK